MINSAPSLPSAYRGRPPTDRSLWLGSRSEVREMNGWRIIVDDPASRRATPARRSATVLTSAISDWRHGLGLARLGWRCPAGSLSHRLPAGLWLEKGLFCSKKRCPAWIRSGA